MKTNELWIVLKAKVSILDNNVYDNFYKAIDASNHQSKYTADCEVMSLDEYFEYLEKINTY